MRMVNDKDISLVVDPSKLKRERCRKEVDQDKASNYRFFTELYFDSRKSATQVMIGVPN